jgi:hypothetical protein
MSLNSYYFGSTVVPKLKSINNKLCVVFTSETFIGKPLIENIGTDCEIMSVPLI